ncbi:LysE family translocator [Oceanimonas pelagia]|uniref:LysE family translocator n=1 Tax=Oceanimonas pelagia TaxID=3028314 RepID=A0AA50KK98_9GAMM|nr:LysE family translocator [Oceanimonas pelagia]WMC09691.1 LysE family translocator [Oceanimonas pelagia]
MNLTLLLAYIGAVLLLLLTPGPVVALITGTAARHGARRAFVTVLGTNAASLVLMALAVLMLAGLLTLPEPRLYGLALAGSAYLGVSAWQDLRDSPASAAADATGGGVARGFWTGISNPKDLLFFVAFFPQFISITQNTSVSLLILSGLWVLFDLLVLSLYIWVIGRWMTGKQGKRVGRLSAWLLLLMGMAGVLYNGVRWLDLFS